MKIFNFLKKQNSDESHFTPFTSSFVVTSSNPGINKSDFKDVEIHSKGFMEMMLRFGGSTFNDGLLTIFNDEDILKWNQISTEYFDNLKGLITCFAYDWLGRIFAIDEREKNQVQILLLDPGFNEVLLMPVSFKELFNVEFVNYKDESLAYQFFKECKEQKNISITYGENIGYKTSMFLGGEDEVSNLEKNDLEVYWELSRQLKPK